MPVIKATVEALRTGAFVTKARILAWSAVFLAGFALAVLFLAASAHGIDDYQGRPLGTDFSSFYTAGTLARHGNQDAPFDPHLQAAAERAIFGRYTPFYSWSYPPFFLLVADPLSYLPYIPALLVWQVSTLALYLGAIALLLRKRLSGQFQRGANWIAIALAFPAVFINVTHGQNGFLTASLLAGGLAMLDEQPALAGVLFGLLAYKPQFILLIPVALLASGRWRALVSLISAVLILACLVTLFFGPGVWTAFLASTHFTRTALLEQGQVGFHKVQSIFAWVRLWGGSAPLAYSIQGAASVGAAALLAFVWRGRAGFGDKGALLTFATLLVTPFCLDYDFMVLAPAIALLAAEGLTRSFRPYEKVLLAALWLVPLLARSAAGAIFLPVGVIAMLLGFAFVALHAISGPGAPISLRNTREQAI